MNSSAGEAVDLVAAVRHEVEHEAQLPDLRREVAHLVLAHARRVPVEGRRQVVGEHLVRVDGVDRVGELLRVRQVGRLGLHPEQVGVRRGRQRLGDGVRDAALHLVVALRGLGQLGVPHHVDAQLAGAGADLVPGRAGRERQPVLAGDVRGGLLVAAELDLVGDRLGQRLQAGLGLPLRQERVAGGVERLVRRGLAVLVGAGDRGDLGRHARALEPGVGLLVLQVADRVEQVAVDLVDALGVELPDRREERRLVGRDRHVGGTEDERLVPLVAAAVDEVGRLGVGAGHDDPGHAHDVELEAGGVEALHLLAGGHEHLAALVAALLGAGLLVLDVVAGDAHLDEAAHEVAHVGVTAVAGVGVGDDPGAEVHLGSGVALGLAHAGARELLVLVRREEGAYEAGGLVRHLAQGVARQVRARVLGGGPLGRRGPAAEVDALDAGPLHLDHLAGRVRPEAGDRLLLAEQLAEAGVEPLGGLARHRVVLRQRAVLLDDLSR